MAEPHGSGRNHRLLTAECLSVQAVGSVSHPSTDMLTHRGEHDTEEPAVAASGAGLAEMEVVFLAFDRSFSARAGIFVKIPEQATSGDRRVKAIVLLGVGVDDATIGRVGAVLGKVRTRGQVRCLLGSSQGATPLEAHAVVAKAAGMHRPSSLADWDALFKPQGAGVAQVIFVALVERDNERHMPALDG